MSRVSAEAEDFVCRWLENKGWLIVARNFRTRRSEVDIVAFKDQVLSFIEVKFARDGSTTIALEKIDSLKQDRIVHAASAYLTSHQPPEEIRFDVAVVRGVPGDMRMGTFVEDAFRPTQD